MFSKTYGYMLRHHGTKRGYWGNWYYKRRYDRVLERLSQLCRKNAILLEFGCGLGFYGKYLNEGGSECRYVGCDIDGNSLKSAYRGNATEYIRCDVQQSPFRERSADIVLCSEVLEHLPSPYQALEDITKIAVGALIVTFPEELLLSNFGDSHPEHVSVLEKEQVTSFLTSKGFRIVQSSHIFSSFIPCGVLEFLHIPRNSFTQTMISSIDKLLEKITPVKLVPHRTILIEAEAQAL
jgi:SAM-dependent methyltransferase